MSTCSNPTSPSSHVGDPSLSGPPSRHPRSGFAHDVLTLATGTAASQLIGILAAPFIAHLFAPSAFGTLAIFASVAGLLSVVSCFRYEVAIYLPEKDEDASGLVVLCLYLVTATTLLTVVLILLGGKAGLRMVHAPELQGYLWLLPLNVFVNGVWTVLNCWNQRKRRFARITAMQVVMRIAMTASQLMLGLMGLVSGIALIATTTFGALATCALLAWQTLRDDRISFASSLSLNLTSYPWRRYRQFPHFGLAASALNSMSFYLPSILLSGFFSTAIVGFYSFGFRVLRVPGMLIGASVNRAFFPRAAEAKHRGALGPPVEQALQYLITLSFFPCFLLALTGSDLFTLFFGPRWREAGIYAQFLSIWLFFWFVSSPLNTVFVVLEEQKVELRFQIANIGTRFAALLIGGFFGSARLAIALFALSGVGVYGAYCLAVIRKSGASLGFLRHVSLFKMALFVPVILLLVVLKGLSVQPAVIAGYVAIILVVYYWQILRSDPSAWRAVTRFLRFRSADLG